MVPGAKLLRANIRSTLLKINKFDLKLAGSTNFRQKWWFHRRVFTVSFDTIVEELICQILAFYSCFEVLEHKPLGKKYAQFT